VTPTELPRQPWQYLGTVGIVRDPPGVPYLYVQGIVAGEDFCIALTINGHRFDRLPGESWDELVARVRNDLDARGDPMNLATCIYDPHVDPKPVRYVQPRFQYENARQW